MLCDSVDVQSLSVKFRKPLTETQRGQKQEIICFPLCPDGPGGTLPPVFHLQTIHLVCPDKARRKSVASLYFIGGNSLFLDGDG